MPGFHLEASGCPISAGRGSKKRKIIGTRSKKRKIIGTRSKKRKMIGKGYVKKNDVLCLEISKNCIFEIIAQLIMD